MMQHTIHTLRAAMEGDLLACHSALERSMVKAICGKEIRELAERLRAQRRLTSSETRIAQEFGLKA